MSLMMNRAALPNVQTIKGVADFVGLIRLAVSSENSEKVLNALADEKAEIEKLHNETEKKIKGNEGVLQKIAKENDSREKVAQRQQAVIQQAQAEKEDLKAQKLALEKQEAAAAKAREEFRDYENKARTEIEALQIEAEKANKQAAHVLENAKSLQNQYEDKLEKLKTLAS